MGNLQVTYVWKCSQQPHNFPTNYLQLTQAYEPYVGNYVHAEILLAYSPIFNLYKAYSILTHNLFD